MAILTVCAGGIGPFPFHTGVSSPVRPDKVCGPCPSSQKALQRITSRSDDSLPTEFSQPGAEKKPQRRFVDNDRVAKRYSRHGRRRARNKTTGNCRFCGDIHAVATGDAEAAMLPRRFGKHACLLDLQHGNRTIRREIWTRKSAYDWMVDRAPVCYSTNLHWTITCCYLRSPLIR